MTAALMHLPRFQRRADHAVQTRVFRGLGVVHDHFVNGFMNEQVGLHGRLIGGGQLSHGDQQGTAFSSNK